MAREQAQAQLEAGRKNAQILARAAEQQNADAMETGPEERDEEGQKGAKARSGHLEHMVEAVNAWEASTNTDPEGKGQSGDQEGRQPVLLLSGQEGIGLATPQELVLVAERNLDTVSLRDTQQTSARRWTHNVGKKISLFVVGIAGKFNLKLITAKGDAKLEAQSGDVEITGDQNVRITANKHKLTAVAGEEMLLACAGAYIRLKGGKIDIHCPGNLSIKSAGHSFDGPASMDVPMRVFPVSDYTQPPGRFTIRPQTKYGQIYAGKPYKVELGGKTYEGTVPSSGIINEELPDGVATGKLTVYPYGKENLPMEWPLDIKNQKDYTKAEGLQSKLKNLGFYDGAVDGDLGKVSKSAFRRFQETLKRSGGSVTEQSDVAAASGKHDF
jgi:uncharacterized protein (DUF2345 family)